MGKMRALLTITGTVQGVSFRKHALKMAQELDVAGWVRNLPGGAVQGCFEGNQGNVEALLAWCHVGPDRARVESVTCERTVSAGEFSDFRILL